MNVVVSTHLIDRGRIDTLSAVDIDSTRIFLPMYRAAFAPLDLVSPARQGLTDDEFVAQMADSSVLKVVGYDSTNQVVGLTFMSSNLTTVPWISPPYFAARFPEQAARNALFYFGGLLVQPAHRAGPWTVLLLEEAYRHVIAAGGVAIFDCCAHNVDKKLPELLARIGRRICVLETEELEPQHYFAYVTKGFR